MDFVDIFDKSINVSTQKKTYQISIKFDETVVFFPQCIYTLSREIFSFCYRFGAISLDRF